MIPVMRTLVLAALLIAAPALAPALAAEPVSPEEFRDFAEGWTLYFERDGRPFGSERFEQGGKVRWRYSDGSCVQGAWRAHEDRLCFLYDSPDEGPLINCWEMMRDDQGLLARLMDGENAGLELRVTRRDRAPLLCGEPGLST
jgi:hypothetical protein